jgi:hypothetical protein
MLSPWLESLCNASGCCEARESCCNSREGKHNDKENTLANRFHNHKTEKTKRGFAASRFPSPGAAKLQRQNVVYADYPFDESAASGQSTARHPEDVDGITHDVVAIFPFESQDPQPFPPNPYPDLSMKPGDRLRVFPAMTQYEWCFVVDTNDEARRGWVPGNYVTANGRDPYLKAGGHLEQYLWDQVHTARSCSASDAIANTGKTEGSETLHRVPLSEVSEVEAADGS